MDNISMMLVCGSALSRIALRSIIGQCADIKIVDDVSDFEAAVTSAKEMSPDVILIDAGVGDFDLAEYTHMVLRGYGLSSGILIVTEAPTDMVWQALRAGAKGFLLERNTPAHLISAVRMVAMGYSLMTTDDDTAAPGHAGACEARGTAVESLTSREIDILGLVARGWSNSDISQALDLAESTVKSHIGNVFVKLGLRNRVHAVIYAYEVGLVRANADQSAASGETRMLPWSAPARRG